MSKGKKRIIYIFAKLYILAIESYQEFFSEAWELLKRIVAVSSLLFLLVVIINIGYLEILGVPFTYFYFSEIGMNGMKVVLFVIQLYLAIAVYELFKAIEEMEIVVSILLMFTIIYPFLRAVYRYKRWKLPMGVTKGLFTFVIVFALTPVWTLIHAIVSLFITSPLLGDYWGPRTILYYTGLLPELKITGSSVTSVIRTPDYTYRVEYPKAVTKELCSIVMSEKKCEDPETKTICIAKILRHLNLENKGNERVIVYPTDKRSYSYDSKLIDERIENNIKAVFRACGKFFDQDQKKPSYIR